MRDLRSRRKCPARRVRFYLSVKPSRPGVVELGFGWMPAMGYVQGQDHVWSESEICGLLDRSAEAVGRALVALYRMQTMEEIVNGTAIERNGAGFSAFDADAGGRMAQKVLNGVELSEAELARGRKMAKKYRRQLAAVANSGGRGGAGSKQGVGAQGNGGSKQG